MSNWKENGNGEYTSFLFDGRLVSVFERDILWRATVNDQMVDDVFFSHLDAIETIEAWDKGEEELTLHPFKKRWDRNEQDEYIRRSRSVDIVVSCAACGNWKISGVQGRCFDKPKDARMYADKRLA